MRALPLTLLLLALPLVTTGTAGAITPSTFIGSLNETRSTSGLPIVELDETYSDSCQNHINYQTLNPNNPYYNNSPHAENPKLVGYTISGDTAARNSILGGTIGRDANGRVWNAYTTAPYHFLQLLNPLMIRTGYAEDSNLITGRGCMFTSPRYTSTGNTTTTPRLYTYPTNDQRVDAYFTPNEWPRSPAEKAGWGNTPQNAIYLMITGRESEHTFTIPTNTAPYNNASPIILTTSARDAYYAIRVNNTTLTSSDGTSIETHALTSLNDDLIVGPNAIITTRALKPNTTYTVSVEVDILTQLGASEYNAYFGADENGYVTVETITKTWSFTTKSACPSNQPESAEPLSVTSTPTTLTLTSACPRLVGYTIKQAGTTRGVIKSGRVILDETNNYTYTTSIPVTPMNTQDQSVTWSTLSANELDTRTTLRLDGTQQISRIYKKISITKKRIRHTKNWRVTLVNSTSNPNLQITLRRNGTKKTRTFTLKTRRVITIKQGTWLVRTGTLNNDFLYAVRLKK